MIMTKYICKPIEVEAFQITEIVKCELERKLGGKRDITVKLENGEVREVPGDMTSRMIPKVGDYWVHTYNPDVYEYLNPQHVFEAKYSKKSVATSFDKSKGLNFGQAIENLKLGNKVLREGWNGKGMWLELQKPDDNSKMTIPYIYMKTACDNLVPWLASQTDVLSDDWQVI